MMIIRQYQAADEPILKDFIHQRLSDKRQLYGVAIPEWLWWQWHLAYVLRYARSCFSLILNDNQMVGYMLGWSNNRQYGLVMVFVILPQIMIQLILKGVFLQRWFWRYIPIWFSHGYWIWNLRRMAFDAHHGYGEVVVMPDVIDGFVKMRCLDETLIARLRKSGCTQLYMSFPKEQASHFINYVDQAFQSCARYRVLSWQQGKYRYDEKDLLCRSI
jgi:hypothetical protein